MPRSTTCPSLDAIHLIERRKRDCNPFEHSAKYSYKDSFGKFNVCISCAAQPQAPISNRILDQAKARTEELFRPMCSSYATLCPSNGTTRPSFAALAFTIIGEHPRSPFAARNNQYLVGLVLCSGEFTIHGPPARFLSMRFPLWRLLSRPILWPL
jgi:hypothetical protein